MTEQNSVEQAKPETIPVSIKFLQNLVNYLQTKPYVEVHEFIDVLVNKK
jgi:hypothetical protein